MRQLPFSLLLLLLPPLSGAQSLLAALAAQPDFTILSSLVSSYPSVFALLSNTTFLAPTDSALSASQLVSSPNSPTLAPNVSASTLATILSYHFLPGLHNLTEMLSRPQGEMVQTQLTNTSYVNIPGNGTKANVVGTKPLLTGVTGNPSGNGSAQCVQVAGGLGQTANISVQNADIPFDGGLIQPIDNVLSLPEECSNTLIANNITSFLYYLSLMSPTAIAKYDNMTGLTCFAPTDSAFAQQSLSGGGGMTTQAIAPLIDNHLYTAVWYTPDLVSGDILVPGWGTNNGSGSAGGQKRGFVFTRDNTTGEMYIGNAKIIKSDWVLTNGVVHIIDQVLDQNASVPWTGAGSTGGVPSSTSSPSATGSSSSGAVGPVRVAVGAVLLALAVGLRFAIWS